MICERRVPARVKGTVYKMVVRPAMLYGLDTVSLKKRQEAELKVAELKMLRFALGVTRMDRIRTEYIRGPAQVGWLTDKASEIVLVRTCAEKRCWVYWETDAEDGVARQEEKNNKRTFMDMM